MSDRQYRAYDAMLEEPSLCGLGVDRLRKGRKEGGNCCGGGRCKEGKKLMDGRIYSCIQAS